MKKILLVIGMHRSGTSMLAGACKIAGANLGSNIMQPQQDNPKGFWEHNRIVQIHDKVLEALGSAWDDPLPLAKEWWRNDVVAPFRKELKELLLQDFSDANLPAIKDPRICRLLPLWSEILDELGWKPKCILIVRNPIEVAASLQRRNGLSPSKSYLLWLRYVLEAEKWSRAYPRVVIQFDRLLYERSELVETVWDELRLPWRELKEQDKASIDSFIEPVLRHHEAISKGLDTDPQLMALVGRAHEGYRELCEGNRRRGRRIFADLEHLVEGMDYMFVPLVGDTRQQAVLAHKALEEQSKQRVMNLEETINRMLSSSSWRVTAPLRALEKGIIRVGKMPRLLSRLGQNIIHRGIRAAYQRLPMSHYRKYHLKDLVFRKLGWIFKGNEAYGSWCRQGLVSATTQADVAMAAEFLVAPGSTGEPLVSVVIPVYNNFKYTKRCFASIMRADVRCPFEIIVVDDGSQDETQKVLSANKNIYYIRNQENLGFIRSCNRGAAKAKGIYLLFLNNDTEVLPGWLSELVYTFNNIPKVGLVGSKLIYPDGRLQEAGGIIWNDASGWNYGRYDDANKPEYNYLRDVDYCSAASIMMPRALFEEVGGFDEKFVPAYYEDTDLAFAIRHVGYRTLYQPLSRVVHYEGITSGTDVMQGMKAYQTDNRIKFLEKWTDVLTSHCKSGTNVFYAKEREIQKRILVIDASTPTPDQDSGSVDAFNLMRILLLLNFKVTFIPAHNFLYMEKYTQDLQRIGVECLYAPYITSVTNHLKEFGRNYNIVILSRVTVAEKHIDSVRKYCQNAKVIFNIVDLHYLREQRQAVIEKSGSLRRKSEKTRTVELSTMKESDCTIMISQFEKDIVHKELPDIRIFNLPLIIDIKNKKHVPFSERRDIFFIGGYQHEPNVDAVLYFVKEVWTKVQERLGDIKFYVIGSNPPQKISELSDKGVIVMGYVEDVSKYFNNFRVSIAPLRYGAGIKGKVGRSMGYGLPCIATTVAVEGMGVKDGEEVLVADGPEDFADKIVKLYSDESLWEKLSSNASRFFEEHYSVGAGTARIKNLIKMLDEFPE